MAKICYSHLFLSFVFCTVLLCNYCPTFKKKLSGFVILVPICNMYAGIYPGSSTNVCFWSKIEFSNVVKCRWGSQCIVSSIMDSWQGSALVGVHGVKPPNDFDLFISEGKISSLNRRNLISQCILNKISMPKCFKIKFYEDWIWKLN